MPKDQHSVARTRKHFDITAEKSKEEIIAQWLKALSDHDLKQFGSFCRIQSETKGEVWMHYQNWSSIQKKYYKNNTANNIIVKPRQVGLTTIELMRDLLFALSHKDSLVFIVFQEQDAARRKMVELQTMVDAIMALEKTIGVKLIAFDNKDPRCRRNVDEISFLNGSSIRIFVAKRNKKDAALTGRGYAVSRLHCSEAALYAYPQETMLSLLAASGNAKEIVVESTANGSSGWFFEHYQRVKQGKDKTWTNHFFPWWENDWHFIHLSKGEEIDMKPQDEYEIKFAHLISQEQMKFWRSKVLNHGIYATLQEYPIDEDTCFNISVGDGSLITGEQTFELMKKCIDPIRKEEVLNIKQPVYIFKDPEPGKEYVMGVDCAHGRGQDSSTFVIVEEQSKETVAVFADNEITLDVFPIIVAEYGGKYNSALAVVEYQGGGISVLTNLHRHICYPKIYSQENREREDIGFHTTGVSRHKLFTNFLEQLSTLSILDMRIIEQAKFISLNGNRYDHPKGKHDDIFFSYLLALAVIKERTNYTNFFCSSGAVSALQSHAKSYSLGRGFGFTR